MKDTVIILAAATLALTLVTLPFISPFIDIFSGAMAGHVPASPLPDPDKGFLSAFIDYYLGLTSGGRIGLDGAGRIGVLSLGHPPLLLMAALSEAASCFQGKPSWRCRGDR